MPPYLPSSSFAIRRIVLDGTAVTLEAEATTTTAACPACGIISQQIHDRYDRHPQDLPWRGCPVRLILRVRRFRCTNRACERRSPTPSGSRGRPALSPSPAVSNGGDALIVQFSPSPQKAASGWPPVADKNLRTVRRAGVFLKQKSRRVAAPRRSTDGTCEKPSMDGISLPRYSAAQHRTTPPVPTPAVAETVPLLSRQTVHLHTSLYNMGRGRQSISYYLASEGRATLLTVYRGNRARERAEIEGAVRTIDQCVREGHTAENLLDEQATSMEGAERRATGAPWGPAGVRHCDASLLSRRGGAPPANGTGPVVARVSGADVRLAVRGGTPGGWEKDGAPLPP
jgi:hypothetical protein